jgi:hypothetical protein
MQFPYFTYVSKHTFATNSFSKALSRTSSKASMIPVQEDGNRSPLEDESFATNDGLSPAREIGQQAAINDLYLSQLVTTSLPLYGSFASTLKCFVVPSSIQYLLVLLLLSIGG